MSKRKIKQYVIKVQDNQFIARLAYSQEDVSIVEKNGFKSHDEAISWLSDEMEKINPSYEKMSFFTLATVLSLNPKDYKAQNNLKDNIEILKDCMFANFVLEEGVPAKQARKQVLQLCGKNWTESFQKAKDRTLDALVSLEEEKSQQRLSKMLDYVKNSEWDASDGAKDVLNIIKRIPGKKIITINGLNDEEVEVFDISDNGVVGYAREHETHLLKKIDIGIESFSVFIIRQFIPNSEESVIFKNGKKGSLPWKAIYSFILKDGNLIPLPAEEVEYSSTHDGSDKPIGNEERVIYKDFSDFLTME